MDHAMMARPGTQARQDAARPGAADPSALQLHKAAPVQRLATIAAALNRGVIQALTIGGAGSAAATTTDAAAAQPTSGPPDAANAGSGAAPGHAVQPPVSNAAAATASATATATPAADTESAPTSEAEAARRVGRVPPSGGQPWVPHKGVIAQPPLAGGHGQGDGHRAVDPILLPLTPARAALHRQQQVLRAAELAQVPNPRFADLLYSSRAGANLPRAQRSVYFRSGRIRMHHNDGPLIEPEFRRRFTFLQRPAAGASSSSAAAAPAPGFYNERDYNAWVRERRGRRGRHPKWMLKPARAGDPGKIFEISGDDHIHPSRGRPVAEGGIHGQGHLDHIVAVARAADIALAGFRHEDMIERRRARGLAGELVLLQRNHAPARQIAAKRRQLLVSRATLVRIRASLKAAALQHNAAIRLAYINPPLSAAASAAASASGGGGAGGSASAGAAAAGGSSSANLRPAPRGAMDVVGMPLRAPPRPHDAQPRPPVYAAGQRVLPRPVLDLQPLLEPHPTPEGAALNAPPDAGPVAAEHRPLLAPEQQAGGGGAQPAPQILSWEQAAAKPGLYGKGGPGPPG